MFRAIATGIFAALAALFGMHQASVAIFPPQPTAALVAATAQITMTASATPPTTSTTTTQQLSDLSNAPSTQNAQRSTSNTTAQQTVIASERNQPSEPSTPSVQTTNAPLLTAMGNPLGYVTESELDQKLQSLQSQIASVASIWPASGPSAPITAAAFAPSQQIGQLTNVTLTNATVNGLTGLTSSDIPDLSGKYLSLNGGTLTGAFTDTSTASSTFAGALGVGTTTPGSLLSLSSIANFTTATSTFYSTGGLNLAAGCFAIGGDCLGLGNISGTLAVNQGGTGANTFGQGWIYSAGGTGVLTASSSPTVNAITATSTTATSSFAGNLSVGGNLNFNGDLLQNGAPFAGSQWTTSGSNIYYTIGNVGIGTAQPSSALQVAGTITGNGATIYGMTTMQAGVVQSTVTPTNIIYDDDCTADVDCIYTLSALMHWMDTGNANVLAFIGDSGTTYSPPMFKISENYYGRTNIPIGAYKGSNVNQSSSYVNSSWNRSTVNQFDSGDTSANYPNCVTTYRTVLAAAPSNSVVIAETGFMSCLAALMQSPADGISSLTGAQLIAQKVKALYEMGGDYPTGNEYNMEGDPVDASYVFANWTSQNGYPPIYMNGASQGAQLTIGIPSWFTNANPAFYAQGVAGVTNRPGWDVLSVYQTIFGTNTFTVSANGTNVVNSLTGANSWSSSTASGQYYLTLLNSVASYNALIDGQSYNGADWYYPESISGNFTANSFQCSSATGCQAYSLHSNSSGNGGLSATVNSTAAGAALSLVNNANATYLESFTNLAPNLTTGHAVESVLGVNAANDNFGSMNFDYVGSGSGSNRIAFGFYGTPEYFSILANGNVGVGTANPYSRLQVSGPDTASTSAFAVVNSASTTEFTVLDNGNATLAGNLIQNSDQRLKTNIQSLDASSSLSELDSLNPVTFNWIDPNKGTTPQLGFIAQQVQSVFPNLVSTTSPTALTPDGTLSLNYGGFIAPIVSAIQSLSSDITSIESTIAAFADSFTTKQLSFDRAQGNEIDVVNVNAQNELCVGSPCVTAAQFQAMVAAAGQTGTSQSGQASGTSDASATSTSDEPPVIQINGDNPATVQVGAAYNDLGATITGPQADLNLGIQTYLNGTLTNPLTIDTSQPATDTIDYVVTDQNGLTATSTRTVIIQSATDAATTTASQ